MLVVRKAGEANETDAFAGGRWRRCDTAIAASAALLTALVHPVQQMLNYPYWLDEAWVADLTRTSWLRAVSVGSPTPVGFGALLRMVPGTGLQRARLVVLGFSMLTVATAYVLTRSLEWQSVARSRFAACVAAVVVMLIPLSLVRNDLKQYTCDGFCALVLLTLGARIDRSSRPAPVWWLGLAAIVMMPFSSTSEFVTAAIFAALLVSAWRAHAKDRVQEILVVGFATAVITGAYFTVLVVPKLSSGLHAYWAGFYLDGSPFHAIRVSWDRLSTLAPLMAMPALVFLAFFAVGTYVLVRMRANAVAIAIPLLWLEMFVVGYLQRYPFLDQRTSTFLFVPSVVIVSIGAIGLVLRVAALRFEAGYAAALALVVAFAIGSGSYVHSLGLAFEDVRGQTVFVAEHHHPNDVILVNGAANFGFAYYWPHGVVKIRRDNSGAGFRARVAGLDVMYMHDTVDTDANVEASLHAAIEKWQRSGRSVLFIVRTHLTAPQRLAWQHAFTALHVQPQVMWVGLEPLLLLYRS